MVYVVTSFAVLTLIYFVLRALFGWNAQQLLSASSESVSPNYNFVDGSRTLDYAEPVQVINNVSDTAIEEDDSEVKFSEQELTQGFDTINKLFLQNSTSDDINQRILSQLCKQIKCFHAALYKADDDKEELSLISGYGLTKSSDKITINYGNGMVGQAVLDNEQIILRQVPAGYVKVASGLGQTDPVWIGIFPLSFKGKAHGVLELCFLYPESEQIKKYLEKVAELYGAHFFNQKVLAKQTQLQQLEQEKLRSEAILEGCADGFIGFNHEGVIEFCNKSASELVRLEKNEILGQSVTELLSLSIRQEAEGSYELIHQGDLETTLTEKTEIQITDSQNEEITVLVTANTISVSGEILFTLFLQKISVDLF